MIEVATWDDSRLDDYRLLAVPEALRTAGLFVAEGRLVVRRLLASSRFETRSVLVTPTAARQLEPVLATVAAPVLVVSQAVMNGVTGFNIHRGCLAIGVRRPLPTLDSLTPGRLRRVLALEGISNPDNVGGLFRSAAAFGVDVVVLGPHCGDPLYRKAIRTSMGAALLVPFVDAGPWPDGLQVLRAAGLAVLALTPDPAATPIAQLALPPRVALLAGAEGPGLSADALAAADYRARIPMTALVDSLNVTTAASIALHALSSAGPPDG
ncbi:MAG: TrmH family RNA methyltransferase [Vicinamibacterales bacterium]